MMHSPGFLSLTSWLLTAAEPWTSYRTLTDLLDRPAGDPDVTAARQAMLGHPDVQDLIAQANEWPGKPLKRHNDASHPIYAFSTLADFGVRAADPGIAPGIEAVLSHQSPEGPFESPVLLPKAFGGSGETEWTWILCDAPTLLYALLAMGLGEDPRVQRAVEQLVGLADETGWSCRAAAELGQFKGPGRRGDPCPIANVYALKALSLAPDYLDSQAVHWGVDMLLRHWEHQGDRKLFMFGIGTDFRKIKYPYVWYDILHVVEVLSRFPIAHDDPRFIEMLATLTGQADQQGRYTAASMYRAWKGWSFANKKEASPWLTFLAARIQRRLGVEF
jgi:hypothetical protein